MESDITRVKLLSPFETADILGITVGTLEVWRATQRYDLKFVKVGRKVMYRQRDVVDFIESRTVVSVSESM